MRGHGRGYSGREEAGARAGGGFYSTSPKLWERPEQMEWLPLSLTALHCAKVVVLIATQRGAR